MIGFHEVYYGIRERKQMEKAEGNSVNDIWWADLLLFLLMPLVLLITVPLFLIPHFGLLKRHTYMEFRFDKKSELVY